MRRDDSPRRPTRPIDLLRVGIGRILSLEEIDSSLSRMPVRLVIDLLSQMARLADNSINDYQKQVEFVANLLPGVEARRALALFSERPDLAPPSSQMVLNLALRALVQCPDIPLDDWNPTAVAHDLGLLLLALADHNRAGLDSADGLAVEIARLKLYYRMQDLSAWYEIALGMFFDELPRLEAHPDYLDFDSIVQAAHGMSLDLFWSLTVLYGLMVQQNPEFNMVPTYSGDMTVSQADVRRWADAWTVDLDAARVKAASDLSAGTWWSFSAFFDRPVVRLSTEGGVAVRPAFLAMRATPAGMFWAIRHPFVEGGGDHEKLARLFGRLVERYGHSLVSRVLPGTTRLTEGDIEQRWGPGQTCDLMLVNGDWVAVEFVHRQLTLASAATGGITALMTDVRRAVVEKLSQIDATLERGLRVERPLPQAIYPLVVVGAPFPTDRLLMERALDEFEQNPPKVIGVEPRCRLPAVMDLAEFSILVQSAAELGTSVASLLQAWHDSGLAGDSFRSWVTTDGPGQALPRRRGHGEGVANLHKTPPVRSETSPDGPAGRGSQSSGPTAGGAGLMEHEPSSSCCESA